jgi:hypothetical protein
MPSRFFPCYKRKSKRNNMQNRKVSLSPWWINLWQM